MSSLTYKRLVSFASNNDGECVVIKHFGGEVTLSRNPPDSGLPSWDYFFTDEPDCFPFKKYNVVGAPI